MDTGIDLRVDDVAVITAAGSLTLAQGRTAGPAGLTRGFRDLIKAYPVNEAGLGALIELTSIGGKALADTLTPDNCFAFAAPPAAASALKETSEPAPTFSATLSRCWMTWPSRISRGDG